MNAYFRNRYAANLKFVQDYKVTKGCADCGYDAHHAGLEFDHVSPRKRGTVSEMMGRSMKMLLEEIEHCEVVCRTCHNIRTWNRKQALMV